MKTQKREKAEALRERAEREAARKTFPDAHLKRKGAAALIHELRVHQIELEMQNDELRNAQAALAESHQKYSDLYNFAPVGYLTLDDEGIIREANLAAAALLDAPRDSLVNKPFHLRVEPGDQDVFFLHRQRVFKEKTLQRCEIRIKRPAGKPIAVQMESAPAGEAAGRPSTFRSVVTDITAIKDASGALRESEEKYRRLFEAARDGILILDYDTGLIADVNPVLIDILGFFRDDLLQKHLWDLGVFKDVAASKTAYSVLQAKGFIRYEDLPLETKDGKICLVEFVSSVYLIGGKKVIQCNVRDITERRKTEEALRETNAELAYFNEAMVGRELRMIELKKEINELCKKAGEPPRYPVD